ncbi:MAG: hypothetical protein AB8G11_17740 [Saprospiraceae bacterium]
MKKILLTTIFGVFLISNTFAQVTKNTLNNAQDGLTACAKQLTSLVTSIDKTKNQGKEIFTKEQKEIDERNAALKIRMKKYQEGKDKEGVMTLDAWPKRIAEKKYIIEEEQAISLMQLRLNARKDDFNIRVKQLEQTITIFSEDILTRANALGEQIDVLGGKIDATEGL